MESDNVNIELEQMREQLSMLKDKLDKENIINDKLLRKIMKTKMSQINRGVLISEITSVFAIIFLTWICSHVFNMPIWFICVTDLFIIAGAIDTYFVYKDVIKKGTFDGELLQVRTKLARMKQMKASSFKYFYSLLLVWYVVFIFEMLPVNDNGAIIGAVVGGVIGAAIGICSYRRQQRSVGEILQQIEEVTTDCK